MDNGEDDLLPLHRMHEEKTRELAEAIRELEVAQEKVTRLHKEIEDIVGYIANVNRSQQGKDSQQEEDEFDHDDWT